MEGNDYGEAYTAIVWGGLLSRESSNPAEAEAVSVAEGNMCGTVKRCAVALPRSETPSRTKGTLWKGDQGGNATTNAPADPEIGHWLRQIVSGFFNYHAVPMSFRALAAFGSYVTRLWRRPLRRRSQKDRFSWTRIEKLADY
jgi:hypothetical protein